MSIYLNKLLTDIDEITTEIRSRKKLGIEQTIRHKNEKSLNEKVSLELKDGWQVLRENRQSVRMSKGKPLSEQLEDEVWTILASMKFDEMSSGRDFKIKVGPDVNSRQIDVFAKDSETAIMVECTSCEVPKKKNMSSLIEKIESFKGKISNSIKAHYDADTKLKLRWVIATRNIEWGTADLEKAKAAKICVLRDNEINYYNKLTSHLKGAAKYQLLAHLFSNEKIDGLDITVPATRGKMGGVTFYNFLIKPSDLLKIVYVSHKASRDIENLETYQRMLQPKRLKSIAAYIDEGGQFPTNIVINIKSKNDLRFDRIDKIGNSSFGRLHLPNHYSAAWIIDGQHRIYGYAHSQRNEEGKKDNATLPVLAYVNMPSEKEAQLFVDINCEQVRVSKNLLNEIYATLKWDSDDYSERIYALRSRVIMTLDSRKTSPFYDRVITTNKDKSHFRCLTLTSFSDGLKENKFFGETLKGTTRQGPLCLETSKKQIDTMNKAIEVLHGYFSMFKEAMPEHWELGDDKGGFICTNNAIRALLRVLKEILAHISWDGRMNASFLDADELLLHIRKYSKPLVDYFSVASTDSLSMFRGRQALKGVNRNALDMMMFIHNCFPNFEPSELKDHLENIDEEGTKDASSLIDTIQRILFQFVMNKLKEHFDDDPEDWWNEGIPVTVRKTCAERRETEKGAKKREQYLCLIDYQNIVAFNWTIFKEDFSSLKSGGKDKQLRWIKELNDIRNITHHAEKWPATKEQVAKVREISKMVSERYSSTDTEAS
jgi:DNA sulfur modification protein DndB